MILLAPAFSLLVQVSAPPPCREWRECRQLAQDAADNGDFEAFHNLAWRTVQTGPPKDPALLYLLARAQALSGRPHDALIMVQRLAEMGIATDAATSDDFQRTRALPGWPDVEELIERVRSRGVTAASTGSAIRTTPAKPTAAANAPKASPSASASNPSASAKPSASTSVSNPTASPNAPPRPTPPETPSISTTSPPTAAAPATAVVSPPARPLLKPERVEEAVHLSIPRFAAGGIAYDVVSRRFVMGDMLGRKLITVSDGSDHAVDLVRGNSAGFHDVQAIEIDERRGDLWVATAAGGDDWTIHKLQLLSGRPLKAMVTPADLNPLKLVDLAITRGGALLALDAAGGRVLVLKPGASNLEAAGPTAAFDAPTSLAATSDENIVYLAHHAGISRVDLRARSAVPVTAPSGLELRGIERIRWHKETLVAVQKSATDDSRSLVRFNLNSAGRTITAGTIIDPTMPTATSPTFITVSGDELSYLVMDPASSGDPRATPTPSNLTDLVVRRIHLP